MKNSIRSNSMRVVKKVVFIVLSIISVCIIYSILLYAFSNMKVSPKNKSFFLNKTNSTSFKRIEQKPNIGNLRSAKVPSNSKSESKKATQIVKLNQNKAIPANYPKFSYMCILVTVPFRPSSTKKNAVTSRIRKTTRKKRKKLTKLSLKTKKLIKSTKLAPKKTNITTKKAQVQTKMDNKILLLLTNLLAMFNNKKPLAITTTKIIPKKPTHRNKVKKLSNIKPKLKLKVKFKKPQVRKRKKNKKIFKMRKATIKKKKPIKLKKSTKKKIKMIQRKRTTKKKKNMANLKLMKKIQKNPKLKTKKVNPKQKKLIRIKIVRKRPVTTKKQLTSKKILQLGPDAQAAILAKLLTFFDPRLINMLNSPNTATNAMRQKTINAIKNRPRPKSIVHHQPVKPLVRFFEMKPLFNLERTSQIECGKRRRRPIKDRTKYVDFEWIVSIRSGCALNKHTCSGTLISNQHVLTTASCIQNLRCARLFIGPNQEPNEIRRLILPSIYGQHTFIYENLQHHSIRPDLAIIKLNRLTDLTPICLPTIDQLRYNINSFKFASFREPNGKVFATNFDSRSCFDGFSRIELRSNKYFCIKHEPSKLINSDMLCNNDEGGPLMFSYNGKWHFYGILFKRLSEDKSNWLNPSCYPNNKSLYSSYSIYEKIYDYIDWINKSIKN